VKIVLFEDTLTTKCRGITVDLSDKKSSTMLSIILPINLRSYVCQVLPVSNRIALFTDSFSALASDLGNRKGLVLRGTGMDPTMLHGIALHLQWHTRHLRNFTCIKTLEASKNERRAKLSSVATNHHGSLHKACSCRAKSRTDKSTAYSKSKHFCPCHIS